MLSFMQMMGKGEKSYWAWACSLTAIIGKTISKQAVFERMNESWLATVKALVAEVISKQASKEVKGKLFHHFTKVWLHDSIYTTISYRDTIPALDSIKKDYQIFITLK